MDCGTQVNDGLLVAMVLKGLPGSFEPFAIHVANNEDNIKFAEFKSMLFLC